MLLHAARATTGTDPHRSASEPPLAAVPPAAAVTTIGDAVEPSDFGQLRHLTKNALQRILAIISDAPELRRIRGGQTLCDDLQQRILIAARLSDALFGLVNEPGTLRTRLIEVSEGLVQLLADDAATIKVAVSVQGNPSPEQENLLVRLAHEMVGNAVKHGMHERLLGDIQVAVQEDAGEISLAVTDDGWGPERETIKGQGLRIVDALLGPVGGHYELRRVGRRTVAQARLPLNARTPAQLQPVS